MADIEQRARFEAWRKSLMSRPNLMRNGESDYEDYDTQIAWSGWQAALASQAQDTERLDWLERTFSGVTNRERYLPVQIIWGKGCNGRSLREAIDKYMAAAPAPEVRDV